MYIFSVQSWSHLNRQLLALFANAVAKMRNK